MLKSKRLLFAAAGAAVVLLVGGGLLFFSGKRSRSEDSAVKADPRFLNIAVFAPKQGPLAIFGESIERGAKTAEKVINDSGGIMRSPVKVHLLDTRSQPKIAGQLAQNTVAAGGFALLVGTASDDETRAVINAAEPQKVPFIYILNGPLKTCQPDNPGKVSNLVWGMGATPLMTVEPLLIFLSDKIRQPEADLKTYYFTSDDQKTKQLADYVVNTAESLDFRTLKFDTIDERIHDFYQYIRRIFDARPDLLVVATSVRNAATLIQQVGKLNVRAEMSIAVFDGLEEEKTRIWDKYADGIYTVDRYAHTVENAENSAMLSAWETLYGKTGTAPTAAAAAAYGSLMIAKSAFEKAQSTDPMRFEQAMSDLDLRLPQGPVMVNSKNHLLSQPLYAVQIEQGKYRILEYLGDVSHPGLEDCLFAPAPAADSKKTQDSD